MSDLPKVEFIGTKDGDDWYQITLPNGHAYSGPYYKNLDYTIATPIFTDNVTHVPCPHCGR